MEFTDVQTARQLVSSATLSTRSTAAFAKMIQTVGDAIPGLRIAGSMKIGSSATVRVYLLFYGPSRLVTETQPLSFALTAGPHGYQLSDLSYFVQLERTILAHRT